MKTERGKAVDAGLRHLFGKLAARPVPEHIGRVVDQLEAAAQPEPAKPCPERTSPPAP
jgi:hypothetical protein